MGPRGGLGFGVWVQVSGRTETYLRCTSATECSPAHLAGGPVREQLPIDLQPTNEWTADKEGVAGGDVKKPPPTGPHPPPGVCAWQGA